MIRFGGVTFFFVISVLFFSHSLYASGGGGEGQENPELKKAMDSLSKSEKEIYKTGYLRFSNFMIPVIQDDELRAYLTFNLLIKIKEESKKERILLDRYILIDLIFSNLYRFFGLLWTGEDDISVEHLQNHIKKMINDNYKSELIEDVFINGFNFRKIKK